MSRFLRVGEGEGGKEKTKKREKGSKKESERKKRETAGECTRKIEKNRGLIVYN